MFSVCVRDDGVVHIPPTVPPRELLTAVLGASADLVVVVDVNGTIDDLVEAAPPVLGRARDDWIGASLLNHVHPDDRTRVVDRLADIWAESDAARPHVPFRAAHAEGYWVSLEMTGGRRIECVNGPGIVIVIRDVTQRAHTERRLRETCRELDFVVSHDSLTGLPNRDILHARLDALARRVRAAESPAHLIMVKVVALDELREFHGVDAVADTLRSLATLVQAELGDQEFVAVDGIGELVVLADPGRSPADIEAVAERLLQLADHPLTGGRKVDLRLSVGVSALHPGESPCTALEQVGRAAALGRRRNACSPVHFEQMPPGDCDPLIVAVDEMRHALSAGELELWFQPILDTRSDHLYGFEGLLRWVDSSGSVRTASDFLPQVEGSAVMIEIGELVLERGCRQLAAWQARLGADAPSLALNISARQLRQSDFAAHVLEQLSASGADPNGLCLELTETHALDREPGAAAQLGRLREQGIRLALDDFGTGYSSLHHLHDIRADILKIDRAFIDRLGHDAGATAIVRASVEMGAAFGMTTVAEGVTTSAQRQVLQVMGCDCIQGYLIGPAVPATTAEAILQGSRRTDVAPSASTLLDIERTGSLLASVDEAYRPSHAEIAVVAGVTTRAVPRERDAAAVAVAGRHVRRRRRAAQRRPRAVTGAR